MGSPNEISCESPEISLRFPDTSQTYITTTPQWPPFWVSPSPSRFSFQRDTASRLGLRLTMRRIAATLAVIALLFSAGSAWADYDDDTASANKLFVESMQLSLSAEDEESPEKKAAALEASLAKLNEIFDEYPSTELAVKLISGQSVGKITLEGVRDAAERAREKADAEADARAKFEMTLKLAEQGLAVAQFNLGRMYTYGSGVPEDYAEAVKWYRMAAEQGHEEAKGWVEYLEAK